VTDTPDTVAAGYSNKTFVFVTGLHRTGTSLLHRLLRAHPDISGFANTGVYEDEGQHLQSVVPTAMAYGGPGRFGFDARAYLDETSPLATRDNAATLYGEWAAHWDLGKPVLLEKSPTTLVRMRFFQALFPNSVFVVSLRHPIAVTRATQKWTKTGTRTLMEHTLACYERALDDLPRLRRAFVLRYEDFVVHPERALAAVCEFIGVAPIPPAETVHSDVNSHYFAAWRRGPLAFRRRRIARDYEIRSRRLGYSLLDPETPLPSAGSQVFEPAAVSRTPQNTAGR
jgi:Sulfotransferase family